MRLNVDFSCRSSFELSGVDKVSRVERKVLYQLLQMLFLDLQQHYMI